MQLSDSFFPTGMYATSSGLESLFLEGRVTDATGLGRLIDSYLRMQVGTADCVALGNAWRGARAGDLGRVVEADETLYLMKLPAETRETSVRTGRQLLSSSSGFAKGRLAERYRRAVGRGRARGTQPVALGVVSNALGIEMMEAASILLYSSLVAVVGAGLRLGMVDHEEGQRLIHSSKRTVVELSKNASKGLDEMRQFFPVLEVAQMAHERVQGGMFVS